MTNFAPVVTATNLRLDAGEHWLRLSDLVTITDADGDTPTTFELWDAIRIERWWVDGDFVDASHGYTVNADSDVRLKVDAFSLGRLERFLWVRASDGEDWSTWEPLSIDLRELPNSAPAVYLPERLTGSAFDLQDPNTASVPFSFGDPDNDGLIAFEIWENADDLAFHADGVLADAANGAQGYVVPFDERIDLQIAPQNEAGYVGTFYVRVTDGLEWSHWDAVDYVYV